jgi:hypothetical protein
LRKTGRVVHLNAVVTTSSRRFEGRSFALTFARWSFLQVLYWLGVRPGTLGRMYAPIRGTGVESKRDDGRSRPAAGCAQAEAGSEEA